MNQSIEQINQALAGFTDVAELGFRARSPQGQYDLRLVLNDSLGDSIVLHCEDVSSLRIVEFGGGLSQFLCLRASDVRGSQLDRVSFHFSDKERDAIAFDCATAEIETSS